MIARTHAAVFSVTGLALGAALLLAGVAEAGSLRSTLGVRKLDHELWQPLETQGLLGIEGDIGLGASPVSVTLGASYSLDSQDVSFVTETASLTELTAGFTLMPRHQRFKPYVGAGVAWVDAEYEVEIFGLTASVSDDSMGYYASAGAHVRLHQGLHLGLDARWTGGTDIQFFEDRFDADSISGALTLGWHWGERARAAAPVRRTRAAEPFPAAVAPRAKAAPRQLASLAVANVAAPPATPATPAPMRNTDGQWWYVAVGSLRDWISHADLR